MTILIDFDGTCVTHDFPNVGKEIGAVPVLKKLVKAGHNLILFTMRSDRLEKKSTGDPNISDVTGLFLTDAVNWFKQHDIPLYGINTNPTQKNWTSSPKAYGELMIDDSALGAPLCINPELSFRPFIDWKTTEKLLKLQGIL